MSAIIHEATKVPLQDLQGARYEGGELPKLKKMQKGRSADVIVHTQNDVHIAIEMNRSYYFGVEVKNAIYAFSLFIQYSKPKDMKIDII